MIPSHLGRQTVSCKSTHNCLVRLVINLAALCDTIARTISELIQDPRFRIPLAALKGFRNGLVWVAHTLQHMHTGTLGISFFRMAWASCDCKINHRSAVYNLRINRHFIVMSLAELLPLRMHLLKVQRQPRQARVVYRV